MRTLPLSPPYCSLRISTLSTHQKSKIRITNIIFPTVEAMMILLRLLLLLLSGADNLVFFYYIAVQCFFRRLVPALPLHFSVLTAPLAMALQTTVNSKLENIGNVLPTRAPRPTTIQHGPTACNELTFSQRYRFYTASIPHRKLALSWFCCCGGGALRYYYYYYYHPHH